MKIITDISVTSARMKHVWSPAQLFSSGASGFWFEPRLASGLTQDAGGTEPVNSAGDSIGNIAQRFTDGPVGTQQNVVARPKWARIPARGVRNRLRHTEDLSHMLWAKIGGTTTASTSQLSPEGQPVQSVTFAPGNPNSLIQQSFPGPLGGPGVQSLWIRAASPTSVRLRVTINGASHASPTVSVGNDWQRIVQIRGNPENVINAVGLQNSASGDSGTVQIASSQFEPGTVRTRYQRVGSEYDVTEPGSPSLWHLFSDMIDDSLVFTPTQAMTDATLWFATETGVTILAGQDIAAAPIDILRGQRTFAFGAFDRPLTTSEQAGLHRYLSEKGAPYA